MLEAGRHPAHADMQASGCCCCGRHLPAVSLLSRSPSFVQAWRQAVGAGTGGMLQSAGTDPTFFLPSHDSLTPGRTRHVTWTLDSYSLTYSRLKLISDPSFHMVDALSTSFQIHRFIWLMHLAPRFRSIVSYG
jgi:hypothetical protein